MKDLDQRVAVVTGAASGIGRGMADAFAAHGMKLVVADIEAKRLDSTINELKASGAEVVGQVVDVSDSAAVTELAELAYSAFGEVNIVCNNAGVAENNLPTWELSLDDWRWVTEINLMGVVHGIHEFVPRMLESGAPGHVVNTASVGGMVSGLALAAYTASKHAVVGLSECLYNDLARRNTQVSASVLCPGWVNTDIGESDRNRKDKPELNEKLSRSREHFKQSLSAGIDPREVGEIVANGVKENRFYLFTHPHWNYAIEDRFSAIKDGMRPASTYLPRE